jgi:hypothetical protein
LVLFPDVLKAWAMGESSLIWIYLFDFGGGAVFPATHINITVCGEGLCSYEI